LVVVDLGFGSVAEYSDIIVAGVPLGRIGSPEDVAGACIFLSSRAGSYVNGLVQLSISLKQYNS
jgi:NAD(P)-dependent dehydrogenase (short-subunit alcohol dehydrogenase family)